VFLQKKKKLRNDVGEKWTEGEKESRKRERERERERV